MPVRVRKAGSIATVPWGSASPVGIASILPGFGGAYASADGLRCLLDTSEAIACGEYFFNLVWDGVGTVGDGNPNPGVWDGHCVFSQGAVPTILGAVKRLGTSVKWDFIQFPKWPVRPATILNSSFYAINAFVKRQDVAWELLRFAAIDGPWQDFATKTMLAPPPTRPWLSAWVHALRALAPILKTKNLSAWIDPGLRGEAYDEYVFFRHAPVEVADIMTL